MKQIISIVLIFSLGFQCLANLGLMTIYQLNKEYISKELCENKDRPRMLCEGKCLLKKSLAHAEKNDRTGIEKQLDIPLFLTVVSERIPTESVTIYKGNTLFLIHYTYTAANAIFHPPLG